MIASIAMLSSCSKAKNTEQTDVASENVVDSIPAKAKYIWTAKVLGIEEANMGRGAAEGKFPAKVVTLEVTALNSSVPFEEGATIHAELVADPTVVPEVGSEYVFKAQDSHPAHALGVYMTETNVQDLTR